MTFAGYGGYQAECQKVNISDISTLVPSITRSGEAKISLQRPRTVVRDKFFTVRAWSAYVRLKTSN